MTPLHSYVCWLFNNDDAGEGFMWYDQRKKANDIVKYLQTKKQDMLMWVWYDKAWKITYILHIQSILDLFFTY